MISIAFLCILFGGLLGCSLIYLGWEARKKRIDDEDFERQWAEREKQVRHEMEQERIRNVGF